MLKAELAETKAKLATLEPPSTYHHVCGDHHRPIQYQEPPCPICELKQQEKEHQARVDGERGAPTVESYVVEPTDDGEWHVLTFSDGMKRMIFTRNPLVIVHPEAH